MENKYYTPDITEFCIGFEYEWNNTNEDDIWRESKAGNEDCYHAVQDIINNLDCKYRVKHLDKGDIESLEWELVEKGGLAEYYEKGVFFMELNFNSNSKYNLIIYDRTKEGINHCFIGYIKNKSELKKIMQQLNIK